MNKSEWIFYENYLNYVTDLIKIFSSKELLESLLLNKNNSTGEMLIPEEMLEELFEIDSINKKNNLLEDKTISSLKIAFNNYFEQYFNGKKSLEEVVGSSDWSYTVDALKKIKNEIKDKIGI